VSLSAAGQVFYQRAKDLLASAAAAAGEVRAAAAAVASQVRIGHFGRWWMRRYAGAVKHFQQECSGVRLVPIELAPADIAGCLRRGELDIALLEAVDVALRIDFKVRRIEAVPGQVVLPAGHPFARKKKVRFEELAEEVWVGWDERVYPGRRGLLLEAAKEVGIRPCIAHDVDSEAAMFDLVASGDAIGYLGLPMEEEVSERVSVVPLAEPLMEFPVYAAWGKDADNLPQLEALGGHLVRWGVKG
jgi:DNA-binding transcriptional LysR family regulator